MADQRQPRRVNRRLRSNVARANLLDVRMRTVTAPAPPFTASISTARRVASALDSTERMRPAPWQWGQRLVAPSKTPMRRRWRLISIRISQLASGFRYKPSQKLADHAMG